MNTNSVAFIIGDYSAVGGVERVTAALMDLFSENELNCNQLISLESSGATAHMDYPADTKVIILSDSNFIRKNFTNPLASTLKKINVSTVIFPGNNVTQALKVIDAARIARCKAIPVMHGSVYASLTKYVSIDEIREQPKLLLSSTFRKLLFPWKWWRHFRMLSQCRDGVVAVSEGCADEIRELFPCLSDYGITTTSIRNPLPFEAPNDSNTTLSQKQKTIIYAGRLERTHKNAMMVIKSWALVSHRYPDWSLIILGDGSLKETMQNYALKNDISNIIFEGVVTNVQSYLVKSTIALLTSDYEGLPMAFIEAAMHQNALISTRSYGGVKDIVKHNQTGLLVDRHDKQGMANAISNLIENKNLREGLAKNAFQHILGICNTERIVSQWKALVNNQPYQVKKESIPISVIIIAANVADTIRNCLLSTMNFKEVIVYINNSNDMTANIARSFPNTKVHEGNFLGFGKTKNYAATLAAADWVFNLDADEILTPAIIQEIAGLHLDKRLVYAVPRCNHFAGHAIRSCGWQHDTPVRIYNRSTTRYDNKKVHESVIVENMQIRKLSGTINHFPFETISELLEKADRYATLFAEENTGIKTSSVSRAVASGIMKFFKSYFLQYGIIDGRTGFVVSSFNGLGSFLKYLKLWEANKKIINN